MNYAGLIKNDVVNGEGICVSFFTQGCPHHCPGCFNPETWDFNGGRPLPTDIKGEIIKALVDNDVKRNFSILGGEPLCEQNKELVNELILSVKTALPHTNIYVWTGYEFSYLQKIKRSDTAINSILENTDVMITGPFEQDKKDLTLKLRGSANQEIWRKNKNGKFILDKD